MNNVNLLLLAVARMRRAKIRRKYIASEEPLWYRAEMGCWRDRDQTLRQDEKGTVSELVIVWNRRTHTYSLCYTASTYTGGNFDEGRFIRNPPEDMRIVARVTKRNSKELRSILGKFAPHEVQASLRHVTGRRVPGHENVF